MDHESNNNVSVCDISTFHSSLEENKLLKSLDEMDIADTIKDEDILNISRAM